MGLLTHLYDILARLFARPHKTMFGTARIYESSWVDGRIRVLDVNGTYQSAAYLDERWCDIVFPYMTLYDRVFSIESPPQTLCMLGGGGFAFPRHVVAHRAPAQIDVVEIDPAIITLAHEHFYLDRLESTWHAQAEGRLRIICSDALEHLKTCVTNGVRYDAIINDCFAAETPNSLLAESEGIKLIRACLETDGVYLTNIITALEGDEATPLERLSQALSACFDHVAAITSDRTAPHEMDNVVVVASNRSVSLPDALSIYDAI